MKRSIRHNVFGKPRRQNQLPYLQLPASSSPSYTKTSSIASSHFPSTYLPTSPNFKMLERFILRSKSVSFIGLGRMGSEMAFNLFSKKFADANDSHFVVCDAVPDNARSFCDNFLGQFPGAKIDIAATPEEWVFRFILPHRNKLLSGLSWPRRLF